MKKLSSLVLGALITFAPLVWAGHDKDKESEFCEVAEDTKDAAKKLEKETKHFAVDLEDTEWESELLLELADELEYSAKKLKSKAKPDKDCKKMKKYFKKLDDAYEEFMDEIDFVFEDFKDDCKKKNKSEKCKDGKDLLKSLSKIEDAFDDLDYKF